MDIGKMQKPLFIFEMANNHQGSVEHGKRIIDAMKEATEGFLDRFDFAMKFQYRDLDTFIHPAMQNRVDIKNVKRFMDTRLSPEQFSELLDYVRKSGLLAICTPFDEISVQRVVEQRYDYIKIASCSFADWPLMEAMAEARLPIIASAAGADLMTVRQVVSFFTNRNISIVLMHCIGEYPTDDDKLQMNQIDLYRREFPELTIGFSTHESPDSMDPVKIAIAKGARVFERHVGVSTENIVLNGYSSNPWQIRNWLVAAAAAFDMCGMEGGRYRPSARESADLEALRRGVFVKEAGIERNEVLKNEDVYFAFPCHPSQLLTTDLSKYNRIIMEKDAVKDAAIMREQVKIENGSELVRQYIGKIVKLLKDSNAVIPVGSICDLSHHYGMENFEKNGLALISCINREYCKKILVVLPGQENPTHTHVMKEETFLVLYGELKVKQNSDDLIVRRGEMLTVERNMPHSFSSDTGCVFEEISTTHYANDSKYEDDANFTYPRKTAVYLTSEIMISAE